MSLRIGHEPPVKALAAGYSHVAERVRETTLEQSLRCTENRSTACLWRMPGNWCIILRIYCIVPALIGTLFRLCNVFVWIKCSYCCNLWTMNRNMINVYRLLQRGQEINQKDRIIILLRSSLFLENHYKRWSRSCTSRRRLRRLYYRSYMYRMRNALLKYFPIPPHHIAREFAHDYAVFTPRARAKHSSSRASITCRAQAPKGLVSPGGSRYRSQSCQRVGRDIAFWESACTPSLIPRVGDWKYRAPSSRLNKLLTGFREIASAKIMQTPRFIWNFPLASHFPLHREFRLLLRKTSALLSFSFDSRAPELAHSVAPLSGNPFFSLASIDMWPNKGQPLRFQSPVQMAALRVRTEPNNRNCDT